MNKEGTRKDKTNKYLFNEYEIYEKREKRMFKNMFTLG